MLGPRIIRAWLKARRILYWLTGAYHAVSERAIHVGHHGLLNAQRLRLLHELMILLIARLLGLELITVTIHPGRRLPCRLHVGVVQIPRGLRLLHRLLIDGIPEPVHRTLLLISLVIARELWLLHIRRR